jgi:hypothetical protein
VALSITQAGTGNSTTSGTTFSVTPTVSFAVNDTVVLCSAHDNRVSGSPYISSVTDSQGNTYSLAAGAKTQGGSGADRATVAIYWCNVTTALSTSDTITITFNGSLAAKAVVLYKISAASNKKASLRLAASATPIPATTNFSGGSPTIINGEAFIRALAIEDSQTVTGDSDTTRGSWSAAYSATAVGASATASMQIFTQTKIVTANGIQTWDVTFTSADTATAYGIFEEVAAFAVLSRTATGSGTGSDYALIPANPSPSDVTDFQFGFRNTPGFYLGPTVVPRTASAAGLGTESASFLHVAVRTVSAQGTSAETATGERIIPRTATASGAGTQTATGQTTRARTANATGIGSAVITGLHLAPRTATANGLGTQMAVGVHVAPRTATASGTGTQVCVGARLKQRTASAAGTGTSVTAIIKLLIFRTPSTTEIRAANRNESDLPTRLFRYAEPTYAGVNVYKLTDGTYTTVEQREYDRIAKVYWGGSANFVTTEEKADLVAAGYGEYVT